MIKVKQNHKLCSSRSIQKRHSDVLRAIKNMKCSQKFRERNFALCFENNKLQNGKPRKFYQMTKDGWMFLVMGFNGEKADAVKSNLLMPLTGWQAN